MSKMFWANSNHLKNFQIWSYFTAELIKKAEERLFAIEAEFSKLIDYFSSSQKAPLDSHPPSMTIQYKKWEDFKTQSTEVRLVAFLLEEKERVFRVSALKNGKVLTYSGGFPEHAKLFKSWLSRELGTSDEKIVEGVLATE